MLQTNEFSEMKSKQAEAECSIRSSEKICISRKTYARADNMDNNRSCCCKPQSLTLSPSVFCDSNQVFYLYSLVCILLLFNAIYVLPLICSILVRAHMPRFWEVWISNRFIHYIHNSRKPSIQLKSAAGISTCVTPIWWSSFFVVRMMKGWVEEQQRWRRWQ